MDFQTFATRRLNTKPVSEGGWNLAHTTNTVPDQGNPLSNPFLVALGHPGVGLGLADRSQDRGTAAEICHGAGRRRAQGHRRRDPGPRLRAGALPAAGAVHDAVGLARQPAGRAEIAGDAALQHRQEVRAIDGEGGCRRLSAAHSQGRAALPSGRHLARHDRGRARRSAPASPCRGRPTSSINGRISTASSTCCGSPRSVLRTPEDFSRAVYEYCRGRRARRQPQARRVLLQSRLLLSQRHRLSVDGRRHDRGHRGGARRNSACRAS